MAIPDYQSLMLPLLEAIWRLGALKSGDAVKIISDHFELTEDERHQLIPSGRQKTIANRVGWAKTYMSKAGLLTTPTWGVWNITERGRQVLSENPTKIDVEYLGRFPEFKAFLGKPRDRANMPEPVLDPFTVGLTHTPEELFEKSFNELRDRLIDELLTKIKMCSPSFFEQLVVDVIVGMGYGGSRAEAGRSVGRSGDQGIDGVISEDRLGLDVLYLQAKRWDENVSRPEVQKFAGALQGKRAKKGIFITTSDYTAEAREFVRNIDAKIVLISGRQLVELMLEHCIGVVVTATYELKRVNSEFFEEDLEAA